MTMTQPTVFEIDALNLGRWLEEEATVLIDVREAVEHASEHIAGAKCHPLSRLDPQEIKNAYPNAKIVVHCQSGLRSATAAQQLAEAGLTVHNLSGGLNAWKQAKLPTVKNPRAPISLFRQVQIVAGSLILSGTVLGFTVSPNWHLLSGFVGAGLTFAGITNTCALGMLLAKLPYNQKAGQTW